jgi:hypothetical protein
MNNLPIYISLVFLATTLLTIWLFFRAANHSKTAFIAIILWSILQSIVTLSGFYLNTTSIPPRIIFLIVPILFLFVGLFNTTKGKQFIDSISIEKLTLLHVVRIPVEIVLFWLYLHKTIPQLMTFEGRNFDILAGITAPIVYYFVFVKQSMSKKMLLVWNFACLALLLNIVVNAILSAPLPFQQFAFDQPNIGILYFPFSLLPSVVVPLVLFAHLVSIRRLLKD